MQYRWWLRATLSESDEKPTPSQVAYHASRVARLQLRTIALPHSSRLTRGKFVGQDARRREILHSIRQFKMNHSRRIVDWGKNEGVGQPPEVTPIIPG
jgi:hypothetical protein